MNDENDGVGRPWAGEWSYYGARPAPKVIAPGDESESASRKRLEYWTRILESVDTRARERVTLTFKRLNNQVRELLRVETGLRLGTGDEVTMIPVEIVDGLPGSFAEILDQHATLAPFLLRRPVLESTSQGLHFLAKASDDVQRLRETWGRGTEIPHMRADALDYTAKYVDALLALVGKSEFLSRLLRLNEDVMGAYFFNAKRVQLYWLPISIIARTMGVSVESLTVIVLAHELAHAYTHVGKDIDGHVWETPAFAGADLHIVEGFAQHYALAVCRRLSIREPDLIPTFDKLLELQSSPYTAFLEWVPNEQESLRGEVMRSALIATRLQSLRKYEPTFLDLIKMREAQVRGVERSE